MIRAGWLLPSGREKEERKFKVSSPGSMHHAKEDLKEVGRLRATNGARCGGSPGRPRASAIKRLGHHHHHHQCLAGRPYLKQWQSVTMENEEFGVTDSVGQTARLSRGGFLGSP